MSTRMKAALAVGICLDCVVIALLVVWIVHSKSAAEFDMLAAEARKTEEINRKLLAKMKDLQAGLPVEYTSDVVLSVSSAVLNKIEKELFPLAYTLDRGAVRGKIRVERFSDFQFVGEDSIVFRLKLIAADMRYNPRGGGLVDSLLSGMHVAERMTLEGTGEISFSFDREKQRLRMKYDIAGIDFRTDLPQFVEKIIKEKLAESLNRKPHYIELKFKPLRVRLGERVTWGRYVVKDVVIRKNRLMAVADLVFASVPSPGKDRSGIRKQ